MFTLDVFSQIRLIMATSRNVRNVCGLLRGLRHYSQFSLPGTQQCSNEIKLKTSDGAEAAVLQRRRQLSTGRIHYSTTPSSTAHETLSVRTVGGIHEVTLPMLSRRETCRFTLQPYADTVGDLINRIQQEDKAIEFVQVRNEADELMASATSIDVMMKQNFYLIINSSRYLVKAESTESPVLASHDVNDDVRHLVASLYRTINSDLYLEAQRRYLLARQERLRLQLEPMEKLKANLERKAARRTRCLEWLGLGLMGAQFGFMARLTWWEYSWDVMEPVTYFVGYATAIAVFGYYVITRQDYINPNARDREFLINLYRQSPGTKFDIDAYNSLRTQLSYIERDLERLRNPLDAHLTLPHLERKKFMIDTSMP